MRNLKKFEAETDDEAATAKLVKNAVTACDAEVAKLIKAGADARMIKALKGKADACTDRFRGSPVEHVVLWNACEVWRLLHYVWQNGRTHSNPDVRRQSNKALTSVRHPGDLNSVRRRLRDICELVEVVEDRIEDRYQERLERRIPLGRGSWELREIRSLRSLKAVGQTLGLCVANHETAEDFLDKPRSEYWAVCSTYLNRALCLLEIDTSNGRRIVDCSGPGGEAWDQSRRTAYNILRALDANGDDDWSFAKIGAFTAFMDGEPSTTLIRIDQSLFMVWAFYDRNEVIVARPEAIGREYWSRFSYADDKFTAAGAEDRNWENDISDEDFDFLAGCHEMQRPLWQFLMPENPDLCFYDHPSDRVITRLLSPSDSLSPHDIFEERLADWFICFMDMPDHFSEAGLRDLGRLIEQGKVNAPEQHRGRRAIVHGQPCRPEEPGRSE